MQWLPAWAALAIAAALYLFARWLPGALRRRFGQGEPIPPPAKRRRNDSIWRTP